jgi:hypothetical protein
MMNYKIDRVVAAENRVVFRVSGRIQWHALDTLRELLGQEKAERAIDLQEVSLVDRETVMFLALSETSGIEIRNCPAYIREWIDRERGEINNSWGEESLSKL